MFPLFCLLFIGDLIRTAPSKEGSNPMSISSRRTAAASAYFIRAMFLSVMIASPILPLLATQAFGLVGVDNSSKNAGAGLVLLVSLQR